MLNRSSLLRVIAYTISCTSLAFISSTSLAAGDSYHHCPSLAQLKVVDGFGHSNWHADHPGWEGYPIGVDNHDTAVVSLIEADWWNYSNDPQNGTMLCWYKGNDGSLIRLSQGSWGGVRAPTLGRKWQKGTEIAGAPISVYKCTAGVGVCGFNLAVS